MQEELLTQLAQVIRDKNRVDDKIAQIIGRPCERGHTGEYIASLILGITLESAANAKYYDGKFTEGTLAGKTVEIKWFGKLEYTLDIKLTQPDYYLVMTGTESPAENSKGKTRPWTINHVFLFDADDLLEKLRNRKKLNGEGIKIGTATSVIQEFWQAAEVYPKPSRKALLILNDAQKKMLNQFS
jgi:hypothetical protein